MQYRMITWRDNYAIFQTDETGRPKGQPVEWDKDIHKMARRVRELNAAQEAEEATALKKKKK